MSVCMSLRSRSIKVSRIMTLLHFINCVGAAYAPYFISYRFSGLSEYSAFWRCVKAGVAYLVTQMIKMLILATLIPVNVAEESDNPILSEALKCTVDVLDILGMYFVINRLLGRTEMKIMATAVGWGTAEMAVTKVVPLWFGARGVEFQWANLQGALDSNVNLLFLMVISTLLWLWNRKDLNKSLFPLVAFLLAFISYHPLVIQAVRHFYGVDPWIVLVSKFIMVVVTGTVSLQMYTAISPPTRNV